MNEDINPIKVIMTLIAMGLIIFIIGVCVKYGNTPVSELPLWVFWLLH